MKIYPERFRICIGERFSFSLQRTLRVPESSDTFPLPPGGAFEIFAAGALRPQGHKDARSS